MLKFMKKIDEKFLSKLIRRPSIITKLKFEQISKILGLAKEIFENEPRLIEITITNSEEAFIIGDIHGNLLSLQTILKIIEKRKPKVIIFLGDYVDRGPHQLECLIIVLSLKILMKNVYILRGNHESYEMNKQYGFFERFFHKYFEEQETDDYGLYHSYHDEANFTDILSVYLVMPICAIVNDSFLCLHGGIPEDIDILNKLIGLKPQDIDDDIAESIEDAVFQILWNDPEPELEGFAMNYRGPGVKFFGEDVINQFMEKYNLKFIIRAHECFPEGFRWFFDRKLLTIFSSSNYRGKFMSNPAAFAIIKNDDLMITTIKIPLD